MLTRHMITRRADTDGVDASVAERDYVLAHIVAQLRHAVPSDGGRLVFKGGTALRLIHMPDHRYSADLDFTVLNGGAQPAIASIADAVEAAKVHGGFPCLEVIGQPGPAIAYIGPLGASKPRRIKLDVSDSELVETVETRELRSAWPDLPRPAPVDVYPLDEITAEKLRCILQRVQCRDLYDLCRLTSDLGVSLGDVRSLFERKAHAKGIDPATFRERFEDRLVRYKSRWATEMGEHMGEPPRFEDVARIIRRHLRQAGLLVD